MPEQSPMLPGMPDPPDASELELLRELGSTGTPIYQGLIQHEYLTELAGQAGYTVYDKMRKSDAQVAAVLSVWKLAIRAAQFYVEPADTEDGTAVEQADMTSFSLFEYGPQTWDSLLAEALTMLDFGFSLFERVYEPLPEPFVGKIGLRRLAYRAPATVYQWLTDEHGGLHGVIQQAPPLFKFVTIPGNKLACFTFQKEGDNFEGTSLLRPMYKHFHIKDTLYRLQVIALERNGLGIPMAIWNEGDISAAAEAKVRQMMQRLRVDSQAGLTVPTSKVTIKMLETPTLGTSVSAFQTAIDHHDLKIAQAALCAFLNLAGGQDGSYALSNDHSQLLMNALNAVADYVCETLNQHVIPQLVQLNYGPQTRYPQIKHSRIGGAHLAALGKTLEGLASGGLLTPDTPTENAIRAELGLPERLDTPEPSGQDSAGEKDGGPDVGGDGGDPDDPTQQGESISATDWGVIKSGLHQLAESTARAGRRGQLTGERPSQYLARTRRKSWGVMR